ncbi:MAG: cupin domain-containing protein [Anaerolineae bacterium]
MHSKKDNVPVSFQAGPDYSRNTEWGEMNVAFERWSAGLDSGPMFKGLPNDACQCPHWGYVIKGKLRILYGDHEETIEAGDAYYLAPGHTTVVESDLEIIEFSPKGEYQKTMEVAMRNMSK